MKDQIVEFLEKLIGEADLKHLPGDFKSRYVDQLRMLVEERIGILALEELHEEHIKDFQKLLSGKEKDQEKIGDFLSEHVPEFEQKVQSVLEEFRDQFLDSVR